MRIPSWFKPENAAPVKSEVDYDDETRTGVVPGPDAAALHGFAAGEVVEHADRCAKNAKGYATGKMTDPCTPNCGCRRAKIVGRGAYLVEGSGNSKIGRAGKKECSTTYASQESCPRSCAFLGNGCYGEGGKVAMAVLECNESCADELQCAYDEASDIVYQMTQLDRLPPIRVHTVGDCRTEKAARLLADACNAYVDEYMGGRGSILRDTDIELKPDASPIWSYSHSWRMIPREAWGKMSILASANTLDEAAEAVKRGYRMCSLVVPENHFKLHDKRRDIIHNGVPLKLIPCAVQLATHKLGAAAAGKKYACSTCQWCWQDRLPQHQGGVILLEVHGVKGDNIEMARLVSAHAGV